MRKLMLVAAAALGTTAGAQSLSDDVQVGLRGCQSGKGGVGVVCGLTMTYTGSDATSNMDLCAHRVDFITNQGETLDGDSWSTANSNNSCLDATIYKGVPLQVSITLNKGAALKDVVKLNVFGRILNVAAAPAPRPSATAPAAPVNLSKYNAALTGCKTSGTTITCTGAVLTPVK